MKDYSPGTWGLAFIFSLEGSVFPKTFICALPNALLAVAFWYTWRAQDGIRDSAGSLTISQVWVTYNWCIGFMVSFRAQRAYARWWEGGTLLQQARGEWFNAYSSLIAFCSHKEAAAESMNLFQQSLARLMSLLYASALMSISTELKSDFEILDVSGFDEEHLGYLRTQQDKCEIILLWIQRLVVENMERGVLPIPPPILSRVFQELSRGVVNIHNVRKITEFQFPFPFAQMIMTMLIVQWVMTPVVCSFLVSSPLWAFLLTFLPVFACWGLNYTAAEIEQPFGIDPNDMPMHFMQTALNSSIVSLLDADAQSPPTFNIASSNNLRTLIMHDPGKLGHEDINDPKVPSHFRSVRHVIIADEDSLYRTRHRFTDKRTQTKLWSSDRGESKRLVSQLSVARASEKSIATAPSGSFHPHPVVPQLRKERISESDNTPSPDVSGRYGSIESNGELRPVNTEVVGTGLPSSAHTGSSNLEDATDSADHRIMEVNALPMFSRTSGDDEVVQPRRHVPAPPTDDPPGCVPLG